MNNRYILVSSFYDGKLKKVGLKFYDTLTEQIRVVFDNTSFMPYFISMTPRQELERLKNNTPSIVKLSSMYLVDPLAGRAVDATKVIVNDSLAISGSEATGKVGLRDVVDAHEADIRTYLNFLYDTRTIPGTYFDGDDGKLVPSTFKTSEGAEKLLVKVLATPGMTDEAKQVFTEWVSLFDQPIPTFKVLALDIETWNERAYKVLNPDAAVMPIIAVSLVGDGGVKEVHVYAKGTHPKLERDFGIIYHATEKSLLTAVLKRVEEYPFLITFNGDAFDLTYIQNRAKALGVKTPFKVKLGKKPKNTEVSLKAGIHIDLYKFHSNKSVANYVYEGRYHEFTLDAISQALLGEGKVEIPTKGDMGILTYEQLVDYSIQDSVLTYKLAARQSQLALKMLVLFSRTSMMPMDDICRHGISTWIKSMLYYQMKKRNLLIPNKSDLESKGGASTVAAIKGKQYQGAIVIDPVPGIYFAVKVLDFASLYPTSIKNFNLSFETVNCLHEECKSRLIPGTKHWSCTKKTGIIALMVGALRDLRVSMYKPLSKSSDVTADERETANTVAQSLKVYLNSVYGVTGFAGFSLFCIPVAESTTALGRYAISSVQSKCVELHMNIVGGDTDSVFVHNPSEEQVAALIKWAKDNLSLDLEVDKSFKLALLSARKKNYLGVLSDGKPVIKGLTGKKSNSPPYIRKAFMSVVDEIVKMSSPEDVESTKTKLLEMAKSDYGKLKERGVPAKDLAVHMKMTESIESYTKNTPQHVQAAKFLVAIGRDVQEGETITFVKVKPQKIKKDDLGPALLDHELTKDEKKARDAKISAKPLEFVENEEIDYDKYEAMFISTFSQVFDPLGLNLDDTSLSPPQTNPSITSLDTFWN